MRVLYISLLLLHGCSPAAPPALEHGGEVRGSLTQHDEQVGDGSFVDRYSLKVADSERIALLVESTDFPPFVAAYVEGTLENLTSTPGAEGATCLGIQSDRDAGLNVAVSSQYGIAMGSYRLRVVGQNEIPSPCRIHSIH